MPAVSKQQAKLMRLVRGVQKGDIPKSKVSAKAKELANTMDPESVKDFAKTPDKGLPQKVSKEQVQAQSGQEDMENDPSLYINSPDKQIEEEDCGCGRTEQAIHTSNKLYLKTAPEEAEKFDADVRVGTIIQAYGFPLFSGLKGENFYKVVSIDGDNVTFRRTNETGDVGNMGLQTYTLGLQAVKDAIESVEVGGGTSGLKIWSQPGEGLSEMGVNDTNYKKVLSIYDLNGSMTRKKVGVAVLKDPNATRDEIADRLRDMNYSDIKDVLKGLRAWKESVNEVKYPTDLKVGSVILGQGSTMLKGIKNGKYYKILDMDDYSATLVPSDKNGNVKGSKKVRHKFDSIEGSIKTFKRGDENGVELVKESVNEASNTEIIKDLDKVKNELLKKVEVLIAKKKKLYSDVDIESPMSADEKKLDKEIADVFSKIQELIRQKRTIKESVNESASTYKDWDEFVNPDYILVTLKNGKKLKISRNNIKGGNAVYQTILKAFNDNNYKITDKIMGAMINKLGESLNEANMLVYRVNPDACEAFLRKYPKIRTVMTAIARKNKDLMKGYKAFLKFKDKQEDYLGGRPETVKSPSFGEKTFWKYDWMGTQGWAELYQYIDGVKAESVNEGLKHFIHIGTPKEIVSKSVASQILTLAKKGVRSNEIGLNMHFVGNEKSAVDAFQKVKNKVYFSLNKTDESVNEARGAKTIQKDFDKVVDEIETTLAAYKKAKGTGKEKAIIAKLKELNAKKKSLETELDDKISGLYKDAELKQETILNKLKQFIREELKRNDKARKKI